MNCSEYDQGVMDTVYDTTHLGSRLSLSQLEKVFFPLYRVQGIDHVECSVYLRGATVQRLIVQLYCSPQLGAREMVLCRGDCNENGGHERISQRLLPHSPA